MRAPVKSFLSALTALLLVCGCNDAVCQESMSHDQLPCKHFVHGKWFDGTTFKANDFYSAKGILTHAGCSSAQEIDLKGLYVIPPFGDAHEHNFDDPSRAKTQSDLYLKDGIFYAQGMTDITSGSVAVRREQLVNTPASVDVTYAHGGLTGINGHPKEVYESIPLGFYYPQTEAQRQQVMRSTKRLGDAYWEVETPADLEKVWPQVLASKPDLIKVYLSDSEEWTPADTRSPELKGGINPALVPLITARAHAAGIKVAAHVDTAHDFHVAVTGGVDEIGHLPGYGLDANSDVAKYRLSNEDIKLCATHHVAVQPTARAAVYDQLPMQDLRARARLQRDNLRRLKRAGVKILIGSDNYGADSVREADYLRCLGVWSSVEMLRMWSITTPQAIFPARHIGTFRTGSEASFLVLDGNPLQAWSATHHIHDRWKQGEHIMK